LVTSTRFESFEGKLPAAVLFHASRPSGQRASEPLSSISKPSPFAVSAGSNAALCGVKKSVQRGSKGCLAAVASAKENRSFAPEK